MYLVPTLKESCGCCTLKTGSFVIAIFILVGSSVQTGLYGFLVDHMYPQSICIDQKNVRVDNPPRPRNTINVDRTEEDSFYHFYRGLLPDFPWRHWPKYGKDGANTTNVDAANSTVVDAANSTAVDAANNTDVEADDTTNVTDRSSARTELRGRNSTRRDRNAVFLVPIYQPYHIISVTYKTPCPRERRPFEVDSNYLDFDLRGPFNKLILYINIAIWATMMAATPLLMLGVYKESVDLLLAWVVIETLLLMLGAASTVATAWLMFGVVPTSIGAVMLVNLAIHLAIDIYYVMVVVNFRRQLTAKDGDNAEEAEQVTVTVTV